MIPRTARGISILLALQFLCSSTLAQKIIPSLVITHVAVIDTSKGTSVPDMDVVIREGQIVSVGKSGGSVPRGAESIDGRGKFLIPGLWDMHVHLSLARASALPALVANGVTYVRDVGSDLAELDSWRAQIADGSLIGPTIVRAGPILNGQEFNRYQLAVTNEAEARAAVRTLKKVGVDFIKLHRRTSREAYFAIIDEARKQGLTVAGHIPMTVKPEEASDAGQTTIEHTETLFEGTFATPHAGQDLAVEIGRWLTTTEPSALFAKFVHNGTAVDPTLIARAYVVRLLQASKPDPRSRYIASSARKEADKLVGNIPANEKLQLQSFVRELQNVTGLMYRSGVMLLAGTDTSVVHPPGFSLQDELVLLVESGLTPTDALRAATLNAVRLFPMLETGSIAVGKRADLVLLDANPLEDIPNTQKIRAVVLRGRYLNRRALDGLLEEAARLAERN